MSAAVYKTAITSDMRDCGRAELRLPKGASPLSLHMQFGYPTVWWMVDPEAEVVKHSVVVVPTGARFDPRVGSYVGSWQEHGGILVWHLFYQGGPA